MGQSGGKLSQRGQPVALLLHASGFADPVGHQADQALGQFRHSLHEFRKLDDGKRRMRPSVTARPVNVDFFIREKGSTPVTSSGLSGKHDRLATEFAAHLKLPFEHDEHGIGGIALAEVNVARFEMQLRSWLRNQSI